MVYYENKETISVTLDNEQLKWIDERVEEKMFDSRSHAVRRGIYLLMRGK